MIAGGSTNTASGFSSSVVGGSGNTASGFNSSVTGGFLNKASGKYSSVTGGQRNTSYNSYEFATGVLNNSTKSTYTYLATGFSIGNGKYENSTYTYHNAFEVKQNGDIYIPDTSTGVADYEAPMIHLQQKIIDLETTITNLKARISALENK